MEPIVVGVADCRTADTAGQVLATYALGSCIGLAVYDPKAMVGGLLHFMLPDSQIALSRARDNPFMFADTGVPLLLQKVRAQGGETRRLVARAAGGSCIMDPDSVFDIGKRNSLALRKILWKAGILLRSEAFGGSHYRTVRLEIQSGRFWLHQDGSQVEWTDSIPRKGTT